MSWPAWRGTRRSGQALESAAGAAELVQAARDLESRTKREKAAQVARITAMATGRKPASSTTQARGPAAPGQGDEMSHSHEMFRRGDAEQPPPFWYPPMAPGREQQCERCSGSGSIYHAEHGTHICRDCAGRGHRRLLQAKCARTGCCDEAVWLHRSKTDKGVTRVEYLCDGHGLRIFAQKLALPPELHKNPNLSRQQFAPADIDREAARERELDERWTARQETRHAQESDEGRAAQVLQLPAGRGVEGA